MNSRSGRHEQNTRDIRYSSPGDLSPAYFFCPADLLHSSAAGVTGICFVSSALLEQTTREALSALEKPRAVADVAPKRSSAFSGRIWGFLRPVCVFPEGVRERPAGGTKTPCGASLRNVFAERLCRAGDCGGPLRQGRYASRRKARGCYSLPCRTTAPGNADGARGSSFSRTPSFRGCKPQHYEKPGLQYQEAQNTPCIFRGCNHLPSLAGASRACGCPPAAADRSGQQPDPTFIAANTINFKLKTIRSNRHETTTYDA